MLKELRQLFPLCIYWYQFYLTHSSFEDENMIYLESLDIFNNKNNFVQVSLLKQRLQNGQIDTELPDPNIQSEPQVQSPTKEIGTENTVEPGSNGRYCSFFKRSWILGNKPAVIYDGVMILKAEHVIVSIYFLEGDNFLEKSVAARGQYNSSKIVNFHKDSNWYILPLSIIMIIL